MVRDFIYLDTERVRSMVSQLEEGLVEEQAVNSGASTSIDGKIQGSLLGLVKGAGGADYLWRRDRSETRTLHDFIYSKLEKRLVKDKRLVKIPDERSDSMAIREGLDDTDFILLTGNVVINAFGRMKKLLGQFNDLGKFLAYCTTSSLEGSLSPKDLTRLKRQKAQEMKIDKQLQDGLQLVIDTFYEELIVLKTAPVPSDPGFRFVGSLRPEYLREEIGSIVHKYGTSPRSKWTVFAQVAAIPEEDDGDESDDDDPRQVKGIENAFQNMFDAVRAMEATLQPIAFPEVAVTPIAVYRV